ncbi:bifunctional 4-hydroxy-2-oxoglutarate aldolase/2-dehydro-3-deoxy-phosphogluconate aldolase [Nonomuraea sp. NPDC050556]|uniref:bifunctional 4-hydroxy-2-oxoglutarate aldolase/2-dehydro-3-deoxy-phosphogluconate aldolase n=1 Tax=Nonomuraea sp. NPDC050556 TaxID=3364369 RepID=UPI0037A1BB45
MVSFLEPVFAILRMESADAAVATAARLAANGVPQVEVTLNTPDALTAIASIREAGGRVGAGTVLTAEQARQAADAGAEFLVTPAVLPEVIEATRLPVLCGALTPTEVLTAWRAGAAAVKIFPASAHGPSYLTALRGPLNDIPLVAVGGIAVEDVPTYLAAGALAVGLGSPLVGTGEGLAERCAKLQTVRRGGLSG